MDYLLLATEGGYFEYPVTKELALSVPEKAFCWCGEKEHMFFYLKGEERVYERTDIITIADENANICIVQFPYQLLIKESSLHIFMNPDKIQDESPIYINEVICRESVIELQEGDKVLAGNCMFIFHDKELVVIGEREAISCNLLELPSRNIPYEGFPRYKRSPRIIKRIKEERIEMNQPPAKSAVKKSSLVQVIVSPLVMLAVTIAMGVVMKRGIYVFVSAATTLMTTVFSIVKYFGEKKECAENDKMREMLYEDYLLNIRKRLQTLRQEEMGALEFHYPSVKSIESMIANYSSRIYERSGHDDDFLSVSIGTTSESASYTVRDCYNELELEKDELVLETKEIRQAFSHIDHKPVVISLKKAHLGLVGDKETIHEQLKLLIAQLTFLHSYHDLEIITIYDEKYKEDFSFLKWYLHCKLRHLNVTGLVHSERVRDQVLGSLNQILKERKQKSEESKKEGKYLPHFLFIIDEPKLIMDHSIMEYLDKSGEELGFSIIYTTHLQANLPENIGTIFWVENSQSGTLLLNEKKSCRKRVTLNHAGNVNFSKMSRDLGVLIHEKGIVSQIPESITFFEMYQVESPAELQVRERWMKNASHKSLAVPLGVRAKEDYVNLNLHEKAHGPHGLVAGTTGSGKSEIVQSYILSLAVNFHPYEVGFLLIDYKGGGMAGLFKDLPHLLGTITNLDGSESMRAMASIKSELARRQRVFSENDVNHINGYNKLFKSGKVDEPIPHLFLISDEFAELKKEQPEFMKELVSAARIGRSLGIHLILATQKPSGVVDDQIWTNSKFKLALKVQNESDSKEILKTPDAAAITQPGRAYLQVGNNEIYELFQSAWSGAAYSDEYVGEQTDNRVYLLNELGQGELINADLSTETESNAIQQTQLDAVVGHIQELFNQTGEAAVRHPWLPPLGDQIKSPYIDMEELTDTVRFEKLDAVTAIGLTDIPEEQRQDEYIIDFIKEGSLAIFGSPGFGKSTLLTTILLSLAVKNSPRLLCSYLLDFGNSALLPLKNLPHVVDYLGFDDVEKLAKLTKQIEEECKKRRQLFAQASAVNLEMYNQISEKKLPAIFILIDNFDMVKELSTEFEGTFGTVTRDGTGLGIYAVIAATRYGAVRYNIINNFRNKIAMYLFDKMDTNSIVGRTNYPLSEKKGRCLVKLDNVNQMQAYTAAESETPMEYMEKIREIVAALDHAYTGERYRTIPMLPENLDITVFREFLPSEQEELPIKSEVRNIPIALSVEAVEPMYMNLNINRQIIVGAPQSGKTNLLKVILEMKPPQTETYLMASKEEELYEYRQKEGLTYLSGVEGIAALLLTLEDIVAYRLSGIAEERMSNPNLTARAYYEQQQPVLIIIEEWDNFLEQLKEAKNPKAEKIILDAAGANVSFLVCTLNSKMKGIDSLTKFMKDAISGIILGNPSEQAIFPASRLRNGQVPAGKGILFHKGNTIAVQIPEI